MDEPPQTDSVDEKKYFKSADIQYSIQHSIQHSIQYSIQYSFLYFKSAEQYVINQQRCKYYILEVSGSYSVSLIVRSLCDDLKWSVLRVFMPRTS